MLKIDLVCNSSGTNKNQQKKNSYITKKVKKEVHPIRSLIAFGHTLKCSYVTVISDTRAEAKNIPGANMSAGHCFFHMQALKLNPD